jgi:hypothetical protein
MSGKNRCRKVSRLLQMMPKRGCEETLRMVFDHLSQCEACKGLHADLQEMDDLLIESKAWLDKLAHQSHISRSQIITQMGLLARRRARRLRAVWAGAAAFLLVIAGAALFFPFDKGGHAPLRAPAAATRTPAVTRAMAAASSSRTLLGVAEVLRRREAPSLELAPAPRLLVRKSLAPPFLRQCAFESDARLGRVVQSEIDLSTPSVPARESFLPPLLQQSTLESGDTLARILRSRVNLTRR